MKKLNIAIVEDDLEFCNQLMDTLNGIDKIKKYKVYKSAEKALLDPYLDKTELILIDINLPGMNGIKLIQELKSNGYNGKIIVLTILDSEEKIFQALSQGAVGYILKSEMGNLNDVINAVMDGGGILSPTIAIRVATKFHSNYSMITDEEKLSEKEKQVLELVIQGENDKYISDMLDITIHTVRFHIGNIFKKLHVNSRIQLISKRKSF